MGLHVFCLVINVTYSNLIKNRFLILQFCHIKLWEQIKERFLMDCMCSSYMCFSGTLECVFYLLSSPLTFGHPQLFAAIQDLIRTLLQTLHGLRFLFSRKDVTNGIIRCLLQVYVREISALWEVALNNLFLYIQQDDQFCIYILWIFLVFDTRTIFFFSMPNV